MTPIKIKLFSAKPYDRSSFDIENGDYGFQIDYFEERLSLKNVVLAKGADAVCIFVNDMIDEALVDALVENGVKLLALRCAGFNNVDVKAAEGKLPIVRVPAYSPYAVAEYTMALMLALNRKVYRAYLRTRDANFSLNGLMGFDMHGKTAGIVGTGKISKVLIPTLLAMGMNVLMYDPYPDNAFAEKTGAKYVTLEELYSQSDIISLHCPLTKDNKYMINSQSIDMMKQGVMIVNTGRGKLINTLDLIEGLKSKKIGSAALDVYEEENEYFFEDRSDAIIDDDTLARLLTFNNVVITSHQAYFTKEAMHNIAAVTLENIKQGCLMQMYPNAVTIE